MYSKFLTSYEDLLLCKVPQPLAKQRSFVKSKPMSLMFGKQAGLILSSLKSREKSNFKSTKSLILTFGP